MRTKRILITGAALLWSAQSFSQGFLHGNDLYTFCTKAEQTPAKTTCAAFIIGAVDALTGTHDICLTKEIIGKQVIDIVVDYLRSHPETRQNTAASEINAALNRFHCNNADAN
jgi:Rap1a immunity proteins